MIEVVNAFIEDHSAMHALIENPLVNVCIGDKKVVHALIEYQRGAFIVGACADREAQWCRQLQRTTFVHALIQDQSGSGTSSGRMWCRHC
jgi:hypothetical protein